MSTCAAGVDEPHGDSTRSPPEAEALGRAPAAPGRLARLRRRVIGLHLLARRMILAPAFSPAPANPTAACGRSSSPSAYHAASAALSASASAASTASTAVQVKADWEPFFSGTAPAAKKIALPENGQNHPGPGRVGPGEAGVGEGDRGACDLANAGSSPVSWRTTEATGLSASAYQLAPVSVSASRDAIRPIRTAGRSPRRRQRTDDGSQDFARHRRAGSRRSWHCLIAGSLHLGARPPRTACPLNLEPGLRCAKQARLHGFWSPLARRRPDLLPAAAPDRWRKEWPAGR